MVIIEYTKNHWNVYFERMNFILCNISKKLLFKRSQQWFFISCLEDKIQVRQYMIRLLCFQFLSPTTSASQSAYHTIYVSMPLFMPFIWSELEYNPTTHTVWVATPSSRGSSQPRDQTQVSHTRASLVAQSIKNPPAMLETWISSLDWENPLEEGMATHSSTYAWRIPMDREAWQAAVHGITKSRTWLSNSSTHTQYLVSRIQFSSFSSGITFSKKSSLYPQVGFNILFQSILCILFSLTLTFDLSVCFCSPFL